MNTTEGNKLIAEFMQYAIIDQSGNHRELEHYMYHENWSWLMPVVEKIESIHPANRVLTSGSITVITAHDNYINETHFIKNQLANKIESVYQSVIDFIQWYNENAAK